LGKKCAEIDVQKARKFAQNARKFAQNARKFKMSYIRTFFRTFVPWFVNKMLSQNSHYRRILAQRQ
jgi:hypothetical protein